MLKKENSANLIIGRITVIALLLAIMFGILQTIPEGKNLGFGVELGLKTVAKVSFTSSLVLFFLYALCIGLELSYNPGLHVLAKLGPLFYDLGISVTAAILWWVFSLFIMIDILSNLQNEVLTNLLLLVSLIVGVGIVILGIKPHFDGYYKIKIRHNP